MPRVRILAYLVCVSLLAQHPSRHPNLSGTWKLNLNRSGPVLPRGTEALTIVIDHRDPLIHYAETRTVAGKTTQGDSGTSKIDGKTRVDRHQPGKVARSVQVWSGSTLITHWDMTESGTTYISDIKTSLSADGKVLTMAEHYREPGMERIRDWIFDKQ